MSKYEIQNETLFETTDGWYCFRDLNGDGFGEYLFRVHQYNELSKKIFGKWIHAPCVPGRPITEYFNTKEQVIRAMARVV